MDLVLALLTHGHQDAFAGFEIILYLRVYALDLSLCDAAEVERKLLVITKTGIGLSKVTFAIGKAERKNRNAK
jgi:hypothetical protein